METESLLWLPVLVVVMVLPFVIGAIWVEKQLEKLHDKPEKCSRANETGSRPPSRATHRKRTMNDQQIEQQIQAKGKTAPRITPADIQAAIASAHYFTAGDGYAGAAALTIEEGGTIAAPEQLDLLTFCVLILRNGFTVTGESACASPANFDPEIGQQVARKNAEEKIWALEGYRLKEWLHQQAQ